MFSSVFLFIMLLAFKHTHLISDFDVFPCIPLRLLSSCTFRAFLLLHRQLPSYFNCISVTTINAVHQHNTRQSGNLYSDRVKHEFAKRCIRFSVTDTVNKTNTSIISKIFTHSIYGFTHYTKDRILQNYDYTCNIDNCYVCGGI